MCKVEPETLCIQDVSSTLELHFQSSQFEFIYCFVVLARNAQILFLATYSGITPRRTWSNLCGVK